MAKQILGRVSILFKGTYDNNTAYEFLDVVEYNGSAYGCLKSCTSVVPTNQEYWQLLASKGEQGVSGRDGVDGKDGKDGTNGQDGYTPVRGTDYWTQEDINTIQSYIDSQLLIVSEELEAI